MPRRQTPKVIKAHIAAPPAPPPELGDEAPLVSVLFRPNLAAYLARGEARPAYKRAFDAQLAVYTGKN